LSHDIFINRYVFHGKLKTVSPFHLGSGEPSRTGEIDNVVIKYNDGTCYIPGSSLKGYLRSTSEKIATQIAKFKDKIQHVSKNKSAIACDLNKIQEDSNVDYSSEELLEKICPICKLYGAMGYSSRIFIPDAPIIPSDQDLGRRVHIKINRDTDSVEEGALFDIQYVQKGECFSFEAWLENVENDDLLLFRLGLFFLLKNEAFFGGNKSRGYGKMGLELEKITKYTLDDIINNTNGTNYPIEDFLNIGGK